MNYWPNKHPDEVLDYKIDWSARLEGDRIVDAQWTVPVGLTKDSSNSSDITTTIWISGGEAGKRYSITCLIETHEGRFMEQTVGLNIH